VLRSLIACLDVRDLTAANECEPERFAIARIVIAVVLAAALLVRQQVALLEVVTLTEIAKLKAKLSQAAGQAGSQIPTLRRMPSVELVLPHGKSARELDHPVDQAKQQKLILAIG